jgi:poly(3-hydroxyalkanoate) synthetase
MIYVRDIAIERSSAIKAFTRLKLVDDFSHFFQIRPFTAEQKFIQISTASAAKVLDSKSSVMNFDLAAWLGD